MGLPASREQLPNGSESIIPASTILLMEDCIIGNKHGPIQVSIPLQGLQIANPGVSNSKTISGTQVLVQQFQLAVGKRLISVGAVVVDSATGRNVSTRLRQ